MPALEFSEKYARMGFFANKVHNCKICPFFTTSVFRMVNHVRTHRSPLTHFDCEKSKIEVYLCKDCNLQTDLTLVMNRHIKKQHSSQPQNVSNSQENKIRRYICKQCSFETYFMLKWLQHARRCLEPNETSTTNATPQTEIKESHQDLSVKWHECNYCSFKTDKKDYLKGHIIKTHHNHVEWHWCDQCPYKAKCYSELNTHKRKRHLNNIDKTDFVWHKCAHCALKTFSLDFLNRHVSEKHKIKCDQCSFKTTQKYHLIRHTLKLHKRERVKWFECDQCPFRSEVKVKWKQHVLKHHVVNEKVSYKCGLCDFKSSAQDLGRHILEIHANSGIH